MSEVERYRGPSLERGADVIDVELISPGVVHDLCGEYHAFVDQQLIICCGCGHAHQAEAACLPEGPCGSYLCCIN